ncbi:putative lipoprotein [Treponema primitia ZAS-2]|uniref:Putative lipoprotein n=1 Tax=Treponema primitia (strain ATCC BAA-887 / DSM 12427 / ZAS-2) TaxID=545694 RepID=F5YN88_TREPZ|nr:M15 family metallopeptidase [Treponema primitia]AEF85158.1 putative lipoprotein [Treponema primitia ZAS-2]
MKKSRSCFLIALILGLTGCALFQKDGVLIIPDERAGPNLVIYFAEKSETRPAAEAIARTSGGELFEISGGAGRKRQRPLPDLLDYETFFVGASLTAGKIPAPLEAFLAETDFLDGRVIPFWTSGDFDGDLNSEFEKRLHGARFLPGGGFLFARKIKTKEIEAMAETWTQDMLTELGLRRAAGGNQAEDMVKLFAAAYSNRFSPAVFQDRDWTLEMDGVRWYYAQGRFLPQEDAYRPEDFRPPFLYRYTPEPSGGEASPWQDTANRILSRRQYTGYGPNRITANPGAKRSPFVEAIWQAGNRTEAYAHQQWIKFLGWSVQVHQDIVAPLSRVEARIQELAQDSPEIQGWIKNLASITAWNWRNVAGSESRSFHAYGVAVDLLMKAQAGMETYWQWTAAKGINWQTVPAEKRQNPPAPVIRAFEEQGFIWGGRWPRYDTMHFEYHPELLILGAGR